MAANIPNPIPTDRATPDAGVRRLSGKLSCDFANVGDGERHTAFGLRVPLLRQLTARRDRTVRAGAASAALS